MNTSLTSSGFRIALNAHLIERFSKAPADLKKKLLSSKQAFRLFYAQAVSEFLAALAPTFSTKR